MLQRSDLSFAIPSSGRAEVCLNTIRMLVPTATVYVAEKEAEDYLRAGVPPAQLRTHPNLDGMGAIRNFLVQDSKTKALVSVDDDLQSVLVRVGRKPRKITDPERIREVAYSTALIASEIGVAMFGWGVQPFPMYYKDSDPMSLSGAFGGAVGYLGKLAKYDDRLKVAEDVDAIMRELLERRVVFSDKRFYWNFGRVMGGVGGLQGKRTEERCRLDKELLKQKWGDQLRISEDKPGVQCHIRVKRRQTWTE
jgi:hypothetical protein